MILKFDFSVHALHCAHDINMAARSKFICSLCDKRYDFKSRYDRHLTSTGHQMMVDILERSKNHRYYTLQLRYRTGRGAFFWGKPLST